MFLANENFPRPSITLLRQFGIEVRSIQEDLPGIPNEQVLRIAKENNQVILTFDKDYGELIFRYQTASPPAVVYFREKGQDPLFAGRILLSMLQEKVSHFDDAFTVVERDSIRQRFYTSKDDS
jgi:predicted nuclease of predicted toxin-antitoxin system